jgi:hypothetical protein
MGFDAARERRGLGAERVTDASVAREPRTSLRVLDPLARSSEVLFGLIMVLTFTSAISAAGGDRSEIRTLLFGAIGCNFAWGVVDAVMYLMAQITERGRAIVLLKRLNRTADDAQAHHAIAAALPRRIADALGPADLEKIRRHLSAEKELPAHPPFESADFLGALGVFLLVVLSTFPVVVPFVLMDRVKPALRTSNAVAIALLFVTGFHLGKYAGVRPWLWGLAMVVLGLALVAITVALGG